MIIVTGAAGFIGSCIVKKLNDMGRKDIIVVDRLEDDDKWLNLRGLYFEEYIHADDFIQMDMLNDIFNKDQIEAVYHMGAISSTTERDVDLLMSNNLNYSKILFGMCSEYDVPYLYASSAATYGAGEKGYSDSHDVVDDLTPLNGYGWSKQLMDEWALRVPAAKTPSKWYGVKFFNVYGPNEYHKGNMKSVVCQAYKQINETGKVKLFKSYKDGYEDGGQLRDFVYVKDCVDAMISLVNEEHCGSNGIYNLGTGKARSFADLARATFKAMGKEENIEYIEMPESLRDQYQYYTQAEMNKLDEAIEGFTFHSLEDGVKDYVQNHLASDNQFYRSRV